jgi:hypothetical protein
MRRVLWAALLPFAACGSCETVPEQALTACQGVTVATARTDILFVVDDSGSMATKQALLAANFADFIDALSRSPATNAYQIGVTTTSVHRYDSTAGTYPDTFASGGDCRSPPYPAGTAYPAGALVSVTGGADPTTRVQSTVNPPRLLAAGSPTLVSDFTANAFVGVCGSGKEQGLEAMKRALSGPLLSGANAAFLRPGARLAVIFVSDDDDCSDPLEQGTSNEPPGCTSYPVQPYVDFLKGQVGGEARSVVVGAIAAVNPVSREPEACTPPGAQAAEHPAARYRAFVAAFGQNGVVDSICQASFRDTLVEIATKIGQEIPLSGAPADPRLLGVTVVKPDGARASCKLTVAGSDGGPSDVVYTPPEGSRPPTLTFGQACALEPGDRVELKVLCVG